jgi:hypothetical protein
MPVLDSQKQYDWMGLLLKVRQQRVRNQHESREELHLQTLQPGSRQTTELAANKKPKIKLSQARQPMPCESTHESQLSPWLSDWHTARSLQSP